MQMSFYAYEIGSSMNHMQLECDIVKQKIKSKRRELKQIAGAINVREAFIKTINLELYYIYKGVDNNVNLRDSIKVN